MESVKNTAAEIGEIPKKDETVEESREEQTDNASVADGEKPSADAAQMADEVEYLRIMVAGLIAQNGEYKSTIARLQAALDRSSEKIEKLEKDLRETENGERIFELEDAICELEEKLQAVISCMNRIYGDITSTFTLVSGPIH